MGWKCPYHTPTLQDKAIQFDWQWHTEQAQERDARNHHQARTGLQGGSSSNAPQQNTPRAE